MFQFFFLLFQELLEKRIKQLEAMLEEEKRKTQRERMAVTKLQNKLIKVRKPFFDTCMNKGKDL